MKLSARGAEMISRFEGFSSKPYRDAVGVWTIGFGSTKGVKSTSAHVTRAQALERMRREVDDVYGAAINQLGLDLNQNQFDALTSFVYNVGPGGVAASTGVGRALRACDWHRAANEMLKWDKAGGKRLLGLTRRRRAEAALFLEPVADPLEGYTPAEKRWIREYDELVRTDRDLARRKSLRRAMTTQRKKIWKAAQESGWDKGNRRARYRSLLARTS